MDTFPCWIIVLFTAEVQQTDRNEKLIICSMSLNTVVLIGVKAAAFTRKHPQ